MKLNFKKDTPPAAQDDAGAIDSAKLAREVTKLGAALQGGIDQLGRDFAKLIELAESLPPQCADVLHQSLRRARVHALVEVEMRRSGVVPFWATDSTLHNRPNLAKELADAGKAIAQRTTQPGE
jgi:hypothetical protein